MDDVEDSEVSSVRTRNLSSDYEPSNDSDEESESDVNTGSFIDTLSENAASAAYQISSDLLHFQKKHSSLLNAIGDLANKIFCLLSTDEIMALFVEETNKYYRERMAKIGGVDQSKPDARDLNWENVTLPEMKAFLAILI